MRFRFLAAFAAITLVALPASLPARAADLAAPAIAATAYTLIDVTSGQTLASQAGGERRDPASLTKLMTAYLVFDALRKKTITPSQMVNVSTRAWKATGSRMFIEPRKAVSVDELLRGMIVQSGNDAAIALAELVSGTEEAFVDAMNKEAVHLGMTNTSFANADGLPDPKHWSTPDDMGKLAVALVRDFPEYYPLFAQKEFRYNNITQPNRNRLLWTDPFVDGLKTGHTEEAGWCLIASAKRGERRLLSVLLGAATDAGRASESQKLLNWGFQTFDTVQLYQAGKAVSTLRVWKGATKEVGAGFVADRYVTLPKGRAADLKLTMHATEPLIAPVASGQRVGTVEVKLDDRSVGEFPLIALNDVASGGLFGRAWDSLRLWFGSGKT